MSYGIVWTCPGCRTRFDLGDPHEACPAFFQVDITDPVFCSAACAGQHILRNDDRQCPVCGEGIEEVGRTRKRRCVNDHVWENQGGLPIYLRNLTESEIEQLRKEGLHA